MPPASINYMTSAATSKPSLWKFGGLRSVDMGKKVWKQFNDDEVTTRGASLAYYFMLAVFPALLFLLSMLGYFASVAFDGCNAGYLR